MARDKNIARRSARINPESEDLPNGGDAHGIVLSSLRAEEDQALARAPNPIAISLTGGAYTQNFDTLANTGTSSVTPTDWLFSESDTAANAFYTAGTGSSSTGDTYSFGATGSTERAFGGLQSGSLVPTIGASFTNNAGGMIASLLIAYTGEQWRLGDTSGRPERLDFQISFNATSLTSGTWVDVNQLDFSSPVSTGAAGLRDGNLAANRTAISFNITGLEIANGATFWIRWLDFNATGSDDGLAADDFSLTPTVVQPGALSIDDVSQAEGNSGTTNFTFTVTRTGGSDGVVGATWTLTLSGAAVAGDFTAFPQTGTVSFADGSSVSQTITINVQGDTNVELDELFTVVLSAPTGGATISDDTGQGTITNDDVNQAPVNTVPGTQGATEDVDFVFSSANGNAISVADADSTPLTVTLSVSSGALTLSGVAGLSFTLGDGTADASMTFSGTAANINAALNGLTYRGTPDFNGGDTLSIVTSDGSLSDTDNVTINVDPVNDPPTLTATATNPTYTEDAAAVTMFSGAAASTVESGQTFTSMTVTVTNVIDGANEILRIDGTDVALTHLNDEVTAVNGLYVSIFVTGTTAEFTITAMSLSAAQLQTLIDTLAYRNTSQNPTDGDRVVSITYLSDSGSAAFPSSNNSNPGLSSTVNVDPVNDDPIVANAIPDQHIDEDSPLNFTFAANAFNDPDGQTLTYSAWQTDNDPLMDWISFNAATRTFTGTPPSNFNGTISIKVIASDGTSSVFDIFDLIVDPVNDAPIAVDDVLAATEDTQVTYAATDLTGNDVDPDGPALVITSVTNPTGGTASLNGDGSVTFTPFANFNGVAGFDYTVSDGSFSDTGHATVNVAAVNDAPVNNGMTGTFSGSAFFEDNGGIAAVTGISVSDVDADPATQEMVFTLQVAHGRLFIFTNVAGGITAGDIIGGANGSSMIVISATQNQINATLASNGLVYGGNAHFNGNDTLTITTNDNGNTGTDPGLTGGPGFEQDTDSKTIFVSARNDAPAVTDGTQSATPIFEDNPSAAGETVASLFNASFSDATDDQAAFGGSSANTLAGIAIVANGSSGASGAWQYFDGSAWIDIGPATQSAAVLIGAATPIRFNPALEFNGPAPTLTAHLVDSSGAAIVDGTTVDLSGPGKTGLFFRYSSGTVTLSQEVIVVNDVPMLTGLAPSAAFDEDDVNSAPQLLDADVGFADAEGDFDGGTLTVTGLLGEDVVAIRNEGTGAGEIGVDGANVTFGGTVVGSFAGGIGDTLTVTFNAAATSEAIEAVIQNLTYANSSDEPTPSRNLRVTVTDPDGASTGPAFAELTGGDNPFDGTGLLGVNAGFIDLDGDRDLDMVFAVGAGFRTFRNDGDFNVTELTGGDNPFNGLASDGLGFTGLDFFDADGDGDLDALTGQAIGTLKLYENNGTGAAFTDWSGANPFSGFSVSAWASPAFLDYDGDGDDDLLLGSDAGTVRLFRNGTSGAPGAFAEISGVANPFSGIDVGGYSQIALADLDGDGDLDLFIGNVAGSFSAFRNNGAGTAATAMPTQFDGISFASGIVTPSLGDINGDGGEDLIFYANVTRTFADTGTGLIAVTVSPVNDAPIAVDDAVNATGNASTVYTVASLIANDSDVDGPALSITAVSNAVNGVAILNGDGTITFTPTNGYSGPASFDYTLSDGSLSDTGRVNVSVLAPLSVTDVTQAEGNSGTTVFTFFVSRPGSSGTVTVDWTLTLSGTADAADFTTTPQSGTVTLNDGDFSAPIFVTVQGDIVFEPSETFTVTLSNPTGGATIADATGDGTITNDDPLLAPTVDLNGANLGSDFDGSYTEQQTSAPIGQNILVNQPAGPLIRATITITDPLIGDLLAIEGTLPATITVDTVNSTPTNLILLGAGASQGDWNAALNLVRYSSSSDNPTDYGAAGGGDRVITVTVADAVQTGPASIATIAITAVNDSPVLGGLDGDTVTFTEGDAPVYLDNTLPLASVVDPDNQNFDGGFLSVAIQVNPLAEDEFVIPTVGSVGTVGNDVYVDGDLIGTITSSGPGQILTISFNALATAERVSTLLGYIAYRNVAGDNPTAGTRSVSWLLNDGQGAADVAVSTVTVAAVNDAPSGAPIVTTTINEDGSHVFTQFNFGFSDTDGDAFAGIVVTTLPTDGQMRLNGSTFAAGTFVTAAQIAAGALVFHPDADENGGSPYASFTFQVRDDGGTDNGGQDTDQSPGTYRFNVNAVNDAPVIGNLGGDSVSYTENGAPVFGDDMSNATVTDIDNAHFGGALLVVNVSINARVEDLLGIATVGPISLSGDAVLHNGTQIGTYFSFVGGTLHVNLNSDATPERVQDLVRAVTYTNLSDDPFTGQRSLTWTINDGSGGQANVLSTVNITAVNDAPEGTGKTVTVIEDTPKILSAVDFPFTDAEGHALLSVTIVTLPGAGTLFYDADGPGGAAPVAVLAGTTFTAAQLGGARLSYVPGPNGNGTGYASFTYTVRDNGGTANGGQDTDASPATITFNVTPTNDAPTSTGLDGDAAAYDEDMPAGIAWLDVGRDALVTDIDSADFAGGSLTVAIIVNKVAGEDQLVLDTASNGVTMVGNEVFVDAISVGTISADGVGLDRVITFNSGATAALVSRLIQNFSYFNTNQATPSTAQRLVEFRLADGDSGTMFAHTTVAVTGTNDAAILSADVRNLTETNSATDISSSGTLTVSDVDSPATFVAQAGTAGAYGTFAIDAAGAWTYTASSAHDEFVVGVIYTDAFTVASSDGTTTSVTINITGTNDAAILSADVRNLTETNSATDISASGTLTVSDVDSPATFVAQAGTAGSYGTFAIDAAGAWTYTASSAHDEFADGMVYTDTFTVASSDGTTTSVTINITGTNDAPSGADATITAVEDSPRLLTQADFGFTDPDIGDAFSAVTITGVAGGTLYYDADGTGGAGLPVAVGSFPQTYTAAELAAGSVSYQANPNLNGTGVGTISFQVIDDSGAVNSSDPSINTLTVSVTAVNDAPTLDLNGAGSGVNNSVSYVENAASTLLAPAALLGDVDSANFDGGFVRAEVVSNAQGSDFLEVVNQGSGAGQIGVSGSVVSYEGTQIGTLQPTGNAGLLIVQLNANATVAAVEALTRALAYFAPTEAPPGGSRGIAVTVADGDGGNVTRTATVNVTPVNDAPSGADKTVIVSEDDTYTFTTADFGFTDTDGNAFASVFVNGVPAQGDLLLNGVQVVSGQTISTADITAGLLTFTPDADEFGANYAEFSFQVQDDGGGSTFFDPSSNKITIDVTSDNLPPVVDLNGAAGGVNYATTFVEDGAAVAIGSGVLVSDPDSGLGDMIESATITLTDRVAGDTLTLTGALPPGIIAVTTPTAGAITIQITGQGTGAQYQALIESILYATTSQDPTVGGTDLARTITVTVNDGTIDSAVATTTVNVTAVDDAPVAQPDAFTITESGTIVGGNLFADNGSGADSDPDGPPLAISAVNGSAGNVGMTFSLGSGALLRVNANGTFDYDPNGAFLPTPTAGSGASNTPGHDGFTYTLAGGNTVTVSIVLTGLDTNDTLLGTAGADILAGGNGNDSYRVENASDLVLESVGGGIDGVYVAMSLAGYALAAGSEVELLSAIDPGSTGAMDLTGNEFANTIIGSAGVNVLIGGGGNDVLAGGLGNDFYRVEDAGDVVLESVGGGTDAVYAVTSYALRAGQEIEMLSAIAPGSSAALDLTGNEFAQTIIGTGGANILIGGGGNDVLAGGAGNDLYRIEGAGAVILENAGGGVDAAYVALALGSYTLNAGAEVETLSAINPSSTVAFDLTGNEFGQTLIGTAGANTLIGRGGDDAMAGGLGNDLYRVEQAGDVVLEYAGGGSDAVYTTTSYTLGSGYEIEVLAAISPASTAALNLTGNEFGNTIFGSDGANILDGKGGNDALVGYGGADIFAFTTALGGSNVDSVFGFVAGTDKIGLDDAVFTAIGATLNANAFVIGAAAADADDRIIYNSATGELFYDADGNGAGAAVQFATLSPGLALTASDFQMI